MRVRATGAEETNRHCSGIMEGAVVLMRSFRGGKRSETYGNNDDDDDDDDDEDEDEDEELEEDELPDDDEEADADAEDDPLSAIAAVATDG